MKEATESGEWNIYIFTFIFERKCEKVKYNIEYIECEEENRKQIEEFEGCTSSYLLNILTLSISFTFWILPSNSRLMAAACSSAESNY